MINPKLQELAVKFFFTHSVIT